ncbi:IscS subfamily cysteine desulfurase [Alteromonas facilis]|uniref:IscS subfamily cysteine desulfurase n=1 Tax=Alteromonas facilis TaxID=2048004 RepID=UPI000C287C9C|nr:IscS subfamily cysteine desulfurase [Alteromonas facilis]
MTQVRTPIYFDYASTRPVDPRVAEKMMQYLTPEGHFGNPASRSHKYGWMAEEAVDIARNQVADLVNADPREIVFTSGATESDNLAIKGAAYANASKGRHIVTLTTEHKAVLDTCEQLEREGFDVTYVNPQSNGILLVDDLLAVLREDTALVSVMHVNNEIGVLQDIAAIGKLCREKGILFHVDAAQSAGKVPIDLQTLCVDLMSFSAHKCYGPKGIGALYVRRKPKVTIQALIHGGGHERGMRSGTLPTHQIVGMGEAFTIAQHEMTQEQTLIAALSQRLWDGIKDIENVTLNGDEHQRCPGYLNICFAGIDGEVLLRGLSDLAVSSGSACNSATMAPSYVLAALGLSEADAHSSLRISIGRFTTEAEVDHAIQVIHDVIPKLRDVANT